jgi:WD40 repeat protein
MKRMLSWIVVGVFLLSCGIMIPSNGAGGKPITIVISSGQTPLPTPPPISLSPINATNADQIQVIYTIHVSDTVRTEDLLAISPDKNWVALTPKDGSPLHVQRLKWTPDGSFVPMGNGFTSFYLYRTASLAFSPDAMHLAIANEADNSVLVFGLDDLPSEAKKDLLSIGDRPEAVTFTKDSQKLIIGTPRGANDSLQLWNLGTISLEREIPSQVPGEVCSTGISPDGKILAAGNCTEPFTISTWEIDGGYAPLTQLARLNHAGACGADPCQGQRNVFAFNPASGEIASGLDFPLISIHDPRTGKLSTSVTTPPAGESSNSGESISALAYTSDGAILVMVANQNLQLIDAKDGKLLWHPQDPRPITAVAISADSKLMVSINASGDMIFWGVLTR